MLKSYIYPLQEVMHAIAILQVLCLSDRTSIWRHLYTSENHDPESAIGLEALARLGF